MHPPRIILTTLLVLTLAHADAEPELIGALPKKHLPEASGMAQSAYDDNRIWFINDSGNKSELIAFDFAEDKSTRVNVKDMKNRDWEDLEAFTIDGEPWLAIADVGDNRGKRREVYIHLLPEPESLDASVRIHTTIALTYADHARDVESMAIDSLTRTIYLLSKRDKVPLLFRVPLPVPEQGATLRAEAEELGEVSSIPEPSTQELMLFSRYGKYRSQPTGMSFLADADADAPRIAVMTYRGAYLAPLAEDRDWLRALNESLCPVATPLLPQGESIAFDASGRLYVTSEGKGAPLYRLPGGCEDEEGGTGAIGGESD